MDQAYEVYCLADPLSYDSPTAATETTATPARSSSVPEGWQRFELDDWLVYRPEDAQLPLRGGRPTPSACLDNAEEILPAVWDY